MFHQTPKILKQLVRNDEDEEEDDEIENDNNYNIIDYMFFNYSEY